MAAPSVPPAPALAGLLAHIRNESAHECAAIEDQAATTVRTILHEARRLARQNVQRALAAERAQIERHCAQERAGIATGLRRQRQRHSHQLLQQGWSLLEAELQRLWQEPEARGRWIGAALSLAAERLLERPWRLRHPPELAQPERDELAARAAMELQWQPDAQLRCGVRIEAGGASLDATPAGLLWQRERLEGWLLAEIEAASHPGQGGA